MVYFRRWYNLHKISHSCFCTLWQVGQQNMKNVCFHGFLPKWSIKSFCKLPHQGCCCVHSTSAVCANMHIAEAIYSVVFLTSCNIETIFVLGFWWHNMRWVYIYSTFLQLTSVINSHCKISMILQVRRKNICCFYEWRERGYCDKADVVFCTPFTQLAQGKWKCVFIESKLCVSVVLLVCRAAASRLSKAGSFKQGFTLCHWMFYVYIYCLLKNVLCIPGFALKTI